MYKYLAVKERLYHVDLGYYKSYEIVCVDTASKMTVERISDVSSNKAFAKSLARKFTEMQLSPLHFRSAVEDAIE